MYALQKSQQIIMIMRLHSVKQTGVVRLHVQISVRCTHLTHVHKFDVSLWHESCHLSTPPFVLQLTLIVLIDLWEPACAAHVHKTYSQHEGLLQQGNGLQAPFPCCPRRKHVHTPSP